MADRLRNISSHLAPARPTVAPVQGLDPVSQDGFTYTRPGGILTTEQRKSYEENGFIVVKNLVPKEKIAQYGARFNAICDGDVYIPSLLVMKDVTIAKSHASVKGEKVITKIQHFQDDDVLFDYCALPQVTEYVKSFTGPDSMAMHTMLINKPPDPGTKSSRHPMHQDLHYFPFRPANRIVCAWTAMEHVHRGNGCLVVVPGTHKGQLLEHGYPDWKGGVNKYYYGVKSYDPAVNDRVWVEMDEGDTVFFHPILLHGSGTNTTSGFRKAISCHYASSHCHYIDVSGTSQQMILDEAKAIITKKMGDDAAQMFDYRDPWKYRARLVSGQKGSLE